MHGHVLYNKLLAKVSDTYPIANFANIYGTLTLMVLQYLQPIFALWFLHFKSRDELSFPGCHLAVHDDVPRCCTIDLLKALPHTFLYEGHASRAVYTSVKPQSHY